MSEFKEFLDATIEKIRALKNVACEMEHEQVLREPDGLRPRQNSAVEHGFQRADYCPMEVRAARLGCAHTPARTNLLRDLKEISNRYPDNQMLQELICQLEQIDREIIEVDWKKSDQELDDARQSMVVVELAAPSLGEQEKLEEILRGTRVLNDQHTRLVGQLDTWRMRTLNELQSLSDALQNG